MGGPPTRRVRRAPTWLGNTNATRRARAPGCTFLGTSCQVPLCHGATGDVACVTKGPIAGALENMGLHSLPSAGKAAGAALSALARSLRLAPSLRSRGLYPRTVINRKVASLCSYGGECQSDFGKCKSLLKATLVHVQ